MMHQIYSRYGLAPYERASTLSSDQIIFYYIYKRLSKHPEKITSAKAWMRFLEKYRKVPRATERRHAWSILTLSGRWDCLEFYGCAYEGCPERAALEEMSAQRVRGERSPEIEDRLWKFGAASKACVQYVFQVSLNRDLDADLAQMQARIILRQGVSNSTLAFT